MATGDGDLIGGSLTFDLTRFKGVDYATPIATQMEATFIKNTRQEALSWNLFIMPLTSKLWGVLAAMAALVAIVIRYDQKKCLLQLSMSALKKYRFQL